MKKTIITASALSAKTQHGSKSYAGFMGNFSKLISACQAIGIKYDPANPGLAIAQLILLLDLLYAKNKAVIDLLEPYKNALQSRNAAYSIMSVYKTQILNTLKASADVTPAQVLTAVNLGKKVDGTRIDPIKDAPLPPVTEPTDITTTEDDVALIEHNSVSFQQFEIRMNNFLIFFTYVTSLACYKTNKIELQLLAIQAYYDTLPILNSAAQLSSKHMGIARQARNVAFFDELIGARHIGTQVKNYISGDFKTKSTEFKSVKGLAFPDLRKK